MKKFILLSAVSCLSTFSFAQVIPNAGFETWVNNQETPQVYSVPQFWISIDALQTELYYLFGDSTYVVHSVSQVSSSHSGSSAVQMRVVQSNEGDTVAGAIFSERSAVHFFDVAFGGSGALGYAFASRPANLTGYRKFTIVGGDTAIAGVVMTKWNTTTNSRDTVVNIQNYQFTTAAANWTSFSIPLTYLLNENPDTCLIVAGIVSSSTPHLGTTFSLDDLAFTGNVAIGIPEQTDNAAVDVYPNPFNEETTVSFHDVMLNHASLEIYDMLGNKVRVMADLNGENITINREGLSSGMYFYNLINNNAIVATGKLSIQ